MEKKTPKTSAQKMALRRSKFLPALRQMGFMRHDKNTGEESPSFSMLETALIDGFVRGDTLVISIGKSKYIANPLPADNAPAPRVMSAVEYAAFRQEQERAAELAAEQADAKKAWLTGGEG